MKTYIIDTERFEVEKIYTDRTIANYDMSDNYSWHPNNRYKLFISHHDVYDYWKHVKEEKGELHEGLGYNENQLFDIFLDWLEE